MDEKQIELADASATSVIEKGIAAARKKQEKPIGFDGCCPCGADIPSERIVMGMYNCVPCQTHLERRKQLYPGGSPS